jgi:hypothetical protein
MSSVTPKASACQVVKLSGSLKVTSAFPLLSVITLACQNAVSLNSPWLFLFLHHHLSSLCCVSYIFFSIIFFKFEEVETANGKPL